MHNNFVLTFAFFLCIASIIANPANSLREYYNSFFQPNRLAPNQSNPLPIPSFSNKPVDRSESKMDIPSFDDIFSQIKMNFWLSGIPFESPKITLRFYFLVFSITVTAVCEIAFFISKISAENLIELTQLAPCTCIGILATLKIVVISTKRLKIYKLTNCLSELYENIINDDVKKNLVKQEFVFLKHLITYFYVLNAILISVYNFSTLFIIFYRYITTNKITFVLPYAVLVPFATDSWPTWLVVYLQTIASGFICVLYFITVDSLYFVTTTHVASHFTLLSNEIINNKGDTEFLNDIVKRHQHILRLSEDLEDIFTAPNLFNVSVGSIEICALVFTLTMANWSDVPGVILFLFSVILQIFMMSFFGEKIIRESRNIGEAAYSSNWHDKDQKYKKTILQLIQRSSKAQRLTAYKFSTISYESFIKIISTSWSYFTILQTVYKTPEGYNQ